MRGVAIAEIRCPRCREPHLAGTVTPYWLWFTCGTHRYEIPDRQSRLGTDAHHTAAALPYGDDVGCMRCGATARTTGPDNDGLTYYRCYRCGEVGRFALTIRDTSTPTDPTGLDGPWIPSESWDEALAPPDRPRRARRPGRLATAWARLAAWANDDDPEGSR